MTTVGIKRTLQIALTDNVAVALEPLQANDTIVVNDHAIKVVEPIDIKHKVALRNLKKNDTVYMYGVPVGRMLKDISAGSAITTLNLKHTAAGYHINDRRTSFPPVTGKILNNRTFMGYQRPDGQAGTANYWLFVPLVFCQNRNIKVLQEALESELGFKEKNPYRTRIRKLAGNVTTDLQEIAVEKKFSNVDGLRFLIHEGGCGGTPKDSETLVDLLAGYIKNPNVAGATVLSLGCQHAQVAMLQKAIAKGFKTDKPVIYFEQQQYPTEQEMMYDLIDATYAGLIKANEIQRTPIPLNKLTIGLECGGSDGFSGITANPLIGHVSDRINAVGGRTLLSEFPELCGVEQDLIDRCVNAKDAQKFIDILKRYSTRAEALGSGFDMNPSPGNIKDGLITDAMKSAGAATKGGRGPVTDVLDYAEYGVKPGLNLLCTPGNDVESTTGLAGSGANIILFSTGLGTPTGNAVCPVIKIATNSALPEKMKDIIDFDAGRMLSEDQSIEVLSDELVDLIIAVASGKKQTCADLLGQEDFIPWKRGVSL